MHAIDYIALSLFLGAHVGTTIAIGLWLNKMAKREVTNAVTNVANGLSERFPMLTGLSGLIKRETQAPQVDTNGPKQRMGTT